MILADTSIWVDHFRAGDAMLANALERGDVLIHPFVIGETSLGSLKDRRRRLAPLGKLRMATMAKPAEIAALIEEKRLYGLGIGYIDVHLLASTLLTPDARLWTRDRRLHAVSERLGIAARLTH